MQKRPAFQKKHSIDSWLDSEVVHTVARVKEEKRCDLHSEADTATSFFWAVKVASFAQGLLQETKRKKNP